MFFWPNLELTDYEKRFCGIYESKVQQIGPDGKPLFEKDGKTPKMWVRPGVKRRTYKVLLNNQANAAVPGLEAVHLTGSVKISRRARVYGLTFAGDTNYWQLQIQTATGEQMTPLLPGGVYPVVSSMVPGTSWDQQASADMAGPSVVTFDVGVLASQLAMNTLPLIIEPNWELLPNETLMFTGVPIPAALASAIILEVAVHIWEFPGMVTGAAGPGSDPARSGAGPSIGRGC